MTSKRRRTRRRNWQGDLVAVLAALLAGAAFLTVKQLASDLYDANQARDALATQVQKLGGTPVAGPPGSRGEAGKSIVGPRGPTGPPGPSGSPGKTGKPGASGSPGAAGASGSPGAAGANGSPGPGGVQGEPGPAGADGKDGADGQPPEGWTYTDPATGADMDCERADNFDPQHPRYTCHATSTPSPTPSDTPRGKGLLGAAVLAMSASYRQLGGPHARTDTPAVPAGGSGRRKSRRRRGGAHR